MTRNATFLDSRLKFRVVKKVNSRYLLAIITCLMLFLIKEPIWPGYKLMLVMKLQRKLMQ